MLTSRCTDLVSNTPKVTW